MTIRLLYLVSEMTYEGVSKMVFVVFPAIIYANKHLNFLPRALNAVSVSPVLRINELYAVVNGVMRVTVRIEIAVSRPHVLHSILLRSSPMSFRK